jgi:molecular chaperone DnaK
MYAAQQAEAGSEDGGEAGKDDDVVDAEFSEVKEDDTKKDA